MVIFGVSTQLQYGSLRNDRGLTHLYGTCTPDPPFEARREADPWIWHWHRWTPRPFRTLFSLFSLLSLPLPFAPPSSYLSLSLVSFIIFHPPPPPPLPPPLFASIFPVWRRATSLLLSTFCRHTTFPGLST